MKNTILIASDSYKSSLSSIEVANSIEIGLRSVLPNDNYIKLAIADGGEGTVTSLLNNIGGELVELTVNDVFGNPTTAHYGILNDDTAILECASPLGLHLLNRAELNPNIASSYGLGQVVLHVLDRGIKNIYIGLGGSSINDGGYGMARALGAVFTDHSEREIYDKVLDLKNLAKIDIKNLDSRIANTKFTILSDVKNTLVGKTGATYVYGPQKGIDDSKIQDFDIALTVYGNVLEETFNRRIVDIESSGAAGGLAAAFIAFCNAKVESGIDKFLELSNFETIIKAVDVVITGEGQMDFQTAFGKAPVGIAKFAKKYDIPVIAIVGSTGRDVESLYEHGIDLILDIVNKPMSLQESIANVKTQLQLASVHCAHAIKLLNRNT